MKAKLNNLIGWIGIALIQGALIPNIIQSIFIERNLPPLIMTLCVFLGLLCFLWISIVTKNKIYTISNSIGLVVNGVTLGLILWQ